MSKIDELLKNEKVEWKRLGEKDVCISIATGLNPRKNFKLNDPSNGELTSWYITTKDYSSNEVIEFVDGKTARITEKARKLINKRSKLQINDILFSAVGTVGKVAFVEVEPNNFDVNESTFVLKPNKKNIVPKYLAYYLRSDFIQNEVKKSLKGSTLAGIRKNKLEDLVIPIPSIETQEKIVKTLDKFTNYVTELQAELQARTKQYEYYRDMLLSEEYLNEISEKLFFEKNNKVKYTTLGEIAQVNRGASPRPISKYITNDENGISWIRIGDIETNSKYVTKTEQKITVEGAKKSRILKKGDFIISNSMSYGRPYILDIDGAIHDGWASISGFNNYLNSDFLYHFLNSSIVQNYWKLKINSSSVSNLNSEIIRSLPIPIVDKEIQNKVVEILDKFQVLLSDTKGLLPQEIEKRQKQYEYYREKLLTFDLEYSSKQASKQDNI